MSGLADDYWARSMPARLAALGCCLMLAVGVADGGDGSGAAARAAEAGRGHLGLGRSDNSTS